MMALLLALKQWLHRLAGVPESEHAIVGRWLMAWGDAFLTGMFTALLVAYKPEWLATWSDGLYLKKP